METLLLQTAQQPPQGSMFSALLPFIMMIAIVWLLIIRPQQKQKKEHQRMIESLKVNDKVLMNSGIIGKIVNIKEDKNIIVLRVDEATNTKIEFQKANVAAVLDKEEGNA
jgi:preprotein translocase subunit YajC